MEKTYQRVRLQNWLRTIAGLWLAIVFALEAMPAQAQGISLISDEETEQLLQKIIKPLFGAANIPYHRNDIHIVNDASLNAFVADGNHLFVHTGTILGADTVDELAGVLAHETGHIQGGHILRQKLKNQDLQEVGLVSAIVAGAAAAMSGNADVAMAAMLGSQSSMLSNYMHYRTAEERAADEAALTLLRKTGQSPQGMLEFMKKIARQNRLSGYEETPYFRTHPVTQERISFFEQALKDKKASDNTALQAEFERVRAKLFAYLETPDRTLRKYGNDDTSPAALYAKSIAYFKQLKFAQAQKLISQLIEREPQNPYLFELKAQIYMETGQIKPAVANYKKALQLMPNSALLQLSYAQSLLEDNPNKTTASEAAKLLNKSLIARANGFAWLLLSRAYKIAENEAGANYAAAEYSTYIGEFEIAKKQLQKAKNLAPTAQLALKIDDLENRLKLK